MYCRSYEIRPYTQGLTSGLFFLNPNGPVNVSGLATINHTANGIVVEGGKRGVVVYQTPTGQAPRGSTIVVYVGRSNG